jgi:hypothetical protein
MGFIVIIPNNFKKNLKNQKFFLPIWALENIKD